MIITFKILKEFANKLIVVINSKMRKNMKSNKCLSLHQQR